MTDLNEWLKILILLGIGIALYWSAKPRPKKEGGDSSESSRPILRWVVILTIIFLLIGWVTYANQKKAEVAELKVAVVRATETRMAEQWVLIWQLPPGQYSRGRTEGTLDVRVLENDATSLLFDAYYDYMGGKKASRFQLSKNGDKFVGSWSQDLPDDSGTVYLSQVADWVWNGQLTDREGKSSSCTLKRVR